MPSRLLSARLARREPPAARAAPDGGSERGGGTATELDQDELDQEAGGVGLPGPASGVIAASPGPAGSRRYAWTMRSQADDA